MIVAKRKIKSCCNRWMKLITGGEHSSAHVTKGRGGEQSVCRAVLVGVCAKGRERGVKISLKSIALSQLARLHCLTVCLAQTSYLSCACVLF